MLKDSEIANYKSTIMGFEGRTSLLKVELQKLVKEN